MNDEQAAPIASTEELRPCPFCGAGTSQIVENGKVWSGMRYGEPSSVSVMHWCRQVAGQPSRTIERVGKDRESAVLAWNTRALGQPISSTAPAVHKPLGLTPERLADLVPPGAVVIEDAQGKPRGVMMTYTELRKFATGLLSTGSVVEPRELTEQAIYDACLSYRHDFGLMPESDRALLVSQAREWARAFGLGHPTPSPQQASQAQGGTS